MTTHDPLCPTNQNDDPDCWFCEHNVRVRADERSKMCPAQACPVREERERIADLLPMKFSMTSARSHDSGCVCHLCAINSTVDAAVDWLRGGESDE